MNPTSIDPRSTPVIAPRLPLAARVAAGLGAAAVTVLCLGSQLALVAVYSGDADTALARLRAAPPSSQMAADTHRHADDEQPLHLAR